MKQQEYRLPAVSAQANHGPALASAHLNSVADTPELRKAYNTSLPQITEFWTRLGADERLYAKYKSIDAASLNGEQRQAHSNALRDFVLGGAELTGDARHHGRPHGRAGRSYPRLADP